ncbi:MAG TPA: DUF2062 domain-containing protein [Vicinamibacterales bacterium]|jgi:hypothetical protein|nr:DUF2062 domain-containing protein [Vicinamibacterales bacterium]
MREAVKRRLEILLHTHDTPRRTAAAYALGVFWGFSAPLGLHTILGLASAFALRLNRVAALLGIYSNLPWIIVPYYMLATVAGAAILGVQLPADLMAEFRNLLEHFTVREAGRFWGRLAPLFWSYVVGTTLGALILALAAYGAALFFILAHRHRVERAKHSDTTTSVM